MELESNGYRVLEGEERARFVRSLQDLTLPPARHLAIFSRRAVLNVGMLLRDEGVVVTRVGHLRQAAGRGRVGIWTSPYPGGDQQEKGTRIVGTPGGSQQEKGY